MMELAKGGELFDKLLEQGCLSEQEAGRLMTQVCQRKIADQIPIIIVLFIFRF